MKRTTLNLLALGFLFSMTLGVGCGSSPEPAGAPTLEPVTINVVESIGVADSPQGPPPVPEKIDQPIVSAHPAQELPATSVNLVESISVYDSASSLPETPVKAFQPVAEAGSNRDLPAVLHYHCGGRRGS